MPTIVVAIVITILVMSFGALILANIGDTMTADSAEANLTDTGIEALADAGDLVGPLGIVAVASVIIGVLFLAFGGGMGRR